MHHKNEEKTDLENPLTILEITIRHRKVSEHNTAKIGVSGYPSKL